MIKRTIGILFAIAAVGVIVFTFAGYGRYTSMVPEHPRAAVTEQAPATLPDLPDLPDRPAEADSLASATAGMPDAAAAHH